MARRKRELLDLLRERAKQKEASRSSEASKPSAPTSPKAPAPPKKEKPKPEAKAPRPAAPKLAPSQSKASQPRRRVSGTRSSGSSAAGVAWFQQHRAPVFATIGLLVILGALKFWPAGSSPVDAGQGGPSNDPSAAEATEPWSILVATYDYSEGTVPIAQATGRAVRDLFPGEDAPKLIVYPQDQPELIELWIGEAEDAAELQGLLRRVQESQVDLDKNNPRPFASARIDRRRKLTAN